MTLTKALDRQKKIYIDGMSGKGVKVPFHFKKLRDSARKRMTKKAWAYMAGGASEEESITNNNINVFSKVAIQPRMMRNIESADINEEMLLHANSSLL